MFNCMFKGILRLMVGILQFLNTKIWLLHQIRLNRIVEFSNNSFIKIDSICAIIDLIF